MPNRHPSPQLLTAFMGGDVSPGSGLAVNVHAERCPSCRAELGYTSADRQGRSVSEQRTAKCLPRHEPPPPAVAGSRALAALRQAPWRWVSPGIRAAKLHDAAGLAESVFLLHLAPGRRVPPSSWASLGQLVVLSGALHVGLETLGDGDFIEPSAAGLPGPARATREGCLCLMATGGEPPTSIPGRVLRLLRADRP